MWNFIKGLFKFVFGTILTVSLAAGIGAVVFAYIFKKDFEDIESIRTLTKKDIIIWQDKILDNNFSNSFNSSLYYAFSSFIKYCMNFDYIEENIVISAGNFKKKIEEKEHKIYNLHQFRRFRRHLDNCVHKQYFSFMFFYGTRPSEALGLQFKDINKNIVHIRHNLQRRGKRELDTPKNQSSVRKLYISLLTRFRIWKLKKCYTKQYGVFKDDYFIFGGLKPLSTTTIDRHKKKACEKAHLYEITQHEFRHSYTTRMIHNKEDIDYVSHSLGHSRVSTTVDVYLHQEKRIRRSIPFFRLFF